MPVRAFARSRGLPVGWLLREISEGRLPALKAGRRLLCRPGVVSSLLEQREQGRTKPGEAGR